MAQTAPRPHILLIDYVHGTAHRAASGQRLLTINRGHRNVEVHPALLSRGGSVHQTYASWSADRNRKADAEPMSRVSEVL